MSKPRYKLSEYDFLDLGCKTGGSILYCSKHFWNKSVSKLPPRGVGVDINQANVEKARRAGVDAIEQDILTLDVKHKFKFVSAIDFLEHMPTLEDAEKIVKKMSELATDFIFIRHPSFEDVEYLKALNLKITWTDWKVHTAPMKIYDFVSMFNNLGLRRYCFNYKKNIESSKNQCIVPLDAPTDTIEYTANLGKKKNVVFEKKVYSMIDIFVALRPIDDKEWNWITRDQ